MYRITKFMIHLYHRCRLPAEVDVPISYYITLKIYDEKQETCRRVDQLVSPSWLSPSWFVADFTVAEMACRRDDRTPNF